MSLEVHLDQRLGGFRLQVDFTAPEGVTALFGPSGAGKSSIVHAVAGLTKPRQGRIVIAGHTVLDTAAGLFVPAERRRAGLVFQDARLFPHMSVETNLLFGWRRAVPRAEPEEIARLIALLGLGPLLGRSPRHLSGGEKARVALGRALLSSPAILLLDEPLASLDQARREEILPWLERLRDIARIPMLYVSHAGDEVARLADRVVRLEAGQVTASGSVFSVLSGVAGLGAVLDGEWVGAENGLSEFAFDGGSLWLARPAGRGRVRLRIAADDILLAREAPKAISANNILPVTVTTLALGEAEADVTLACGAARLTARITAASARRLELAPGVQAFAIVKSVTLAGPARSAP